MLREAHDVDLYFDFVSPYSYLALTQVEEFGERHGVRWNLQPVVYGALLDATGLVGPVEVPAKRRYTLRDITAAALRAGVFGVPTFRCRGELFWGHDRMLQLAARLGGSLPAVDAPAAQMEGRPRGADRAAAPARRGPADAE